MYQNSAIHNYVSAGVGSSLWRNSKKKGQNPLIFWSLVLFVDIGRHFFDITLDSSRKKSYGKISRDNLKLSIEL
ncbi:MAG: hypothetical protein CL912_21995 [Deltaproteobacteria bacterium]|nr:hypothetical protein [Deltaproteobacteria bacterium]